MRQCNECGKEFVSGNSYRVHKYRFHRVPKQDKLAEIRQFVETTELTPQHEPEPKFETVSEPKTTTTEQSTQNDDRWGRREITRNSGSDDLGSLLAIGGAVAGLILLLLFGGKKQ